MVDILLRVAMSAELSSFWGKCTQPLCGSKVSGIVISSDDLEFQVLAVDDSIGVIDELFGGDICDTALKMTNEAAHNTDHSNHAEPTRETAQEEHPPCI